ncbi:MAG: uncharacterized protein KVP18_001683, partial [Porospora cf. gigantea A]
MAPLHALLRAPAASPKRTPKSAGQVESLSGYHGGRLASFADDLALFIEEHPRGLSSAPIPSDPGLAVFLNEIREAGPGLPDWLRERRIVVLEDTLASGKTTLVRRLESTGSSEPPALAEEWLDTCSHYGWDASEILALPFQPKENLIMGLTILGLIRLRRRQPEAKEIISDRCLLATIFQWGHVSSAHVARWFLGVPPLSLYHPEQTSFIVADFPDEVTRERIQRRARMVGDQTEEDYYFADQGRRYRRVRRGLRRYLYWLKAVFSDVQVVTTDEERLGALRRLQFLPPAPESLAVTLATKLSDNKHRPISWSPDCTSAVQTAVQRLSEAVLTVPTDGDEYLLETDASALA